MVTLWRLVASPRLGTMIATRDEMTAKGIPLQAARTKPTVVTITDRNYVLPVYILLGSLRYHRVICHIDVLGVDLTEAQVRLLEQFPETKVHRADPSNPGNAATRKAEAILLGSTRESDFITLLDGDSIATGDISDRLNPPQPGILSRRKSTAEDTAVYRSRYASGEEPGGVPRAVLDRWREDVGERETPAITNTVIGGNLTIHRDYLGFVRKWQDQMTKVLPRYDTRIAYDFDSEAYHQMDESVLNSLLAFAYDAPPIREYLFNQDVNAYVAHLGPGKPRFWNLWRLEKIRYHKQVRRILKWARDSGYDLPELPWTLRSRNTPAVYVSALGHYSLRKTKQAAERARYGLAPRRMGQSLSSWRSGATSLKREPSEKRKIIPTADTT